MVRVSIDAAAVVFYLHLQVPVQVPKCEAHLGVPCIRVADHVGQGLAHDLKDVDLFVGREQGRGQPVDAAFGVLFQ